MRSEIEQVTRGPDGALRVSAKMAVTLEKGTLTGEVVYRVRRRENADTYAITAVEKLKL